MITRLRIQNYKSLEDVELKDLKPVVLVSSENNIGKTNLLEALFLFYSREDPTRTIRHWGFRGLPGVPNDTQAFLGAIFHNFDIDQEITIDVDDVFCGIESMTFGVQKEPNGTTTFAAGSAAVSKPLLALNAPIKPLVITLTKGDDVFQCQVTFAITPTKQLQIIVNGSIPGKGNVFFMSTHGGMDSNEEAILFGKLDVQKKIQELVSVMKIIDSRVESLSVVAFGGANVIHCDIGLSQKVPLRLSGDGTVRVLQYLLAIALAQDSLVLFDEFDSGFHYLIKPQLFKALANYAKVNNCQMFCTTHSYECLVKAVEAFKGQGEADFCYIRLEKVNGRVVAKYYDYGALATAIGNDWEVR